MQKRTDLIVCEECDAVYQRMALGEREIARCLRCGAELERDTGRRLQHLLPLTIGALILFVIAQILLMVIASVSRGVI